MVSKSKKLIKELSVFFPTYNEEKNIAKVTKNTMKVLKKVADKWEIIIVNDGSKDDTKRVAEKLAKKYKGVRVITHKVNRGYGGALKTGYKSARFEWVAFIDSDGQFDFNEIVNFIRLQKKTGADVVLGIREERADSALRRLFTFVWSKLLPRILFGLKVSDYSCGFKLVRKRVFNKVEPLVGEEKVTQIEMLVKAQKLGFKFAQLKVKHYPRKHGHQTGADFKVIKKSVIDLFTLWKQLRRQNA